MKLGIVVVLGSLSKLSDFGFKRSRVRVTYGPLVSDCCRNNDEEPYHCRFIQAEDVIQRRGFASPRSALFFFQLITVMLTRTGHARTRTRTGTRTKPTRTRTRTRT